MYVPGVDIPHFCAQCDNAPCVESCKFDALSVSPKTGAILVDRNKCTACGACIWACPGNIPHLHPNGKYALICDLCDGDPQCVRVCKDGKWDVLEIESSKHAIIGFWDALHKLYAQTPEKITERVVKAVYGEAGEDLL